MIYATKQNMIDRFGEKELIELTDRVEPLTNAIVDGVLDQALASASAQIDSFVARRYDLPLANLPPVLNEACMVIAYYKLHRGRHRDEDRKEYEDVLAFLSQISNGTALLDVGGTEPPSAPAQVVSDAADRTFSRTDKKRWF